MDCSYDDAIDTACRACGDPAAGWTFAPDGRRVYVCSACAATLGRYETGGGAAPHPQGQLCAGCDRLTHAVNLDAQQRCPDCGGPA
jgi:DNA-directed RNA polymerase subunit RPC12/RpoP